MIGHLKKLAIKIITILVLLTLWTDKIFEIQFNFQVVETFYDYSWGH